MNIIVYANRQRFSIEESLLIDFLIKNGVQLDQKTEIREVVDEKKSDSRFILNETKNG